MGNVDDRQPRLFIGRVEQLLHVERIAFHPGREAGGRQQIVQLHRQRRAIFDRKERFEIDEADFRKRRRLDGANHARQIETLAGAPGLFENLRQQNMLAAAHRIGFDAQQRQQTRHRGDQLFSQRIGIVEHHFRRRGERF